MERFVSDSGDLYNLDRVDWAENPLREEYARHYASIRTGRELCATLRAGEYTFPGGYRLAFITDDGAILSFDAVRDNLYQVIYSIRHNINDGWRVIGTFIVDNSDDAVYCDHTSELLGGD